MDNCEIQRQIQVFSVRERGRGKGWHRSKHVACERVAAFILIPIKANGSRIETSGTNTNVFWKIK
jgi:hypothetical protein